MQQRRTLHTLFSSPPLSSDWRDHAALTATTGEAPPCLLHLLSLSPGKTPSPATSFSSSPSIPLSSLFRRWKHRRTTNRPSSVGEIDNNKMTIYACSFGQRASARTSQLQAPPPLLFSRVRLSKIKTGALKLRPVDSGRSITTHRAPTSHSDQWI
uniref:Uncharacterized protein n=1 Tax=Solanum tuberosum TaxID=4113 RepID=M1BGX7_SOLTU